MGLRVLARVRPERALLEGVVSTALVLLEPREGLTERAQAQENLPNS
jgi:TetR/AcrR family transcriptional regulator, transcriptional repressor for nem operon